MISFIRKRLGAKIFASYLIVIILGIVTLLIFTEIAIPSVYLNHMSPIFENNSVEMNMMMGEELNVDDGVYAIFRLAVVEAVIKAGSIAFVVAIAVSIFVSKRIILPIEEMKLASQKIASGDFHHRVNIPGDISEEYLDEISQLAINFNRMAEKLYVTETMRKQLIGDVSHELRTPLTTIKGTIEGLIDGVIAPSQENFYQIYREAGRLQRLVADLQELSIIESDSISLDLGSSDLSKLLKSIGHQMQSQFDDKGVSLDIKTIDGLPKVLIDEDRIAQVLINLFGNALQYTNENGKVFVSLKQVEDEIHISISDTGIGISQQHIPHIFTRFYRVDKSRSRAGGGSGIGLTIANLLIQLHGGKIWVDSGGKNKGSTFNISFPALQS